MMAAEIFLAASFGIVAGTMLWSIVGRWILALLDTWRTYRSTEISGTSGRKRNWALALVVLLHSGPWSLALAIYLSCYVLSHPHPSWWHWFFGGALAAPVLLLAAWRRGVQRRKQSELKRSDARNQA
jgi:hypothetical protein